MFEATSTPVREWDRFPVAGKFIGTGRIRLTTDDGTIIGLGGIREVDPAPGVDGRLVKLIIRTIDIVAASAIAIGDILRVEGVMTKDAHGNLFDQPLVNDFGRLKVVFNHPRFEIKAFAVQTIVMVPVV